MKHAGIIRRVMITEKGTRLACENKYMLEVAPKSNKIEIRKAVEHLFKVKVISVNTMRVHGKKRRQGRYVGMTSERKKAIVTLKKGDKIQIMEGL